MPERMDVTDVRVRLLDQPERGIVGWVSCVVAGIALHNIAVRRLPDGRIALGFPARFSRGGVKHYYFNPTDREARRAIEDAVFARLSLRNPIMPKGGKEATGE